MRPVASWLPTFALPCLLLVTSGCELMVAGPRVSAEDVWERTYALGPTPSVAIANTNGAVVVEVHEAPRVDVRAERRVQAVTEQGAQELLAATTIAEDVSEHAVSLTTKRPSSFSMGQQAEVRYTVRVPHGTSLALKTTNGTLTLTGVQGVIDLETVNGQVRGTGLGQVRRAETVNGSVKVALDRLPPSGALFETVNGSVEIAMPAGIAADVDVRTVNGSISVRNFDRVEEGERRRRRFDGRLNGGGPAIRVETVNGSVTLEGRGPTS